MPPERNDLHYARMALSIYRHNHHHRRPRRHRRPHHQKPHKTEKIRQILLRWVLQRLRRRLPYARRREEISSLWNSPHTALTMWTLPHNNHGHTHFCGYDHFFCFEMWIIPQKYVGFLRKTSLFLLTSGRECGIIYIIKKTGGQHDNR